MSQALLSAQLAALDGSLLLEPLPLLPVPAQHAPLVAPPAPAQLFAEHVLLAIRLLALLALSALPLTPLAPALLAISGLAELALHAPEDAALALALLPALPATKLII